jgi:hypothetical protein
MVYISFRKFRTRESEYLFFLSCKARMFFPENNIRLYDKNSESDYFFFLHQNQNFFFSNIGNQNIFLEKKTIPTLEVKWSVPYSLCNLYSTSPPYSEVLTDIYLFFLRTLHFLSLPNCLLFGFVLTP